MGISPQDRYFYYILLSIETKCNHRRPVARALFDSLIQSTFCCQFSCVCARVVCSRAPAFLSKAISFCRLHDFQNESKKIAFVSHALDVDTVICTLVQLLTDSIGSSMSDTFGWKLCPDITALKTLICKMSLFVLMHFHMKRN